VGAIEGGNFGLIDKERHLFFGQRHATDRQVTNDHCPMCLS